MFKIIFTCEISFKNPHSYEHFWILPGMPLQLDTSVEMRILLELLSKKRAAHAEDMSEKASKQFSSIKAEKISIEEARRFMQYGPFESFVFILFCCLLISLRFFTLALPME